MHVKRIQLTLPRTLTPIYTSPAAKQCDLPWALHHWTLTAGPRCPVKAQLHYQAPGLLQKADRTAGFLPVLTKLKQNKGNSAHLKMLQSHTMPTEQTAALQSLSTLAPSPFVTNQCPKSSKHQVNWVGGEGVISLTQSR